FEDRGDHFAQAAHHPLDAFDVIVDVAKEGLGVLVDTGQIEMDELAGDVEHRAQDAAKQDQLTSQAKQAADLLTLKKGRKHVLFHLQHLVFDLLHHRQIAVDDEVKNGV